MLCWYVTRNAAAQTLPSIPVATPLLGVQEMFGNREMGLLDIVHVKAGAGTHLSGSQRPQRR